MHRSSALLRKAIYNDKYYCTVYVYQCGCIMCARSYETLTSPFPLSFALVRLRRHRHFSLTASQLVQYFFLFCFFSVFIIYYTNWIVSIFEKFVSFFHPPLSVLFLLEAHVGRSQNKKKETRKKIFWLVVELLGPLVNHARVMIRN